MLKKFLNFLPLDAIIHPRQKPKAFVEILIFLSLALAIVCFLQGLERPGQIFLAFFFVSFIGLILHDVIKFLIKKIRRK